MYIYPGDCKFATKAFKQLPTSRLKTLFFVIQISKTYYSKMWPNREIETCVNN